MEKNASPSAGLPRREFIKKAATAAAAAAAAPLLRTSVYGQNQAPSAGVTGANNRIAVAVIGVGFGIGKDHLQGIHKNCAQNNTVVAAACDVYNRRRDWAKQTAELKDSDLYVDYKKLLERKDIDAVLIATHDPVHAQMSIDALQAGKHVYCEKPMTRYLDEAFKVYDAVKSTGKIFQVGSQGCSAAGWHKCAELIQERQAWHPRLGAGLLLPQQRGRRMELRHRRRLHRSEHRLGKMAGTSQQAGALQR